MGLKKPNKSGNKLSEEEAERLLNETESPNQREEGFDIDETTKRLPVNNKNQASPWDAFKKRWVK